MAFITHFGKRKLYLINHTHSVENNLRHLSKFIVQQIHREFNEAVYNDQIAGILYNFDCESKIKSQLSKNECYFELLIPADAIAHITSDGQVFIHSGYTLKVLALKTWSKTYRYDADQGMFIERETDTMRLANRRTYNYAPQKWPLFAERKRLFPMNPLLQDPDLAMES